MTPQRVPEMLKEVFTIRSFKARSLLWSLPERKTSERNIRDQMRKTSVTIAIDLVTGQVSAESLLRDTLQEVIEDRSDPDQDLHQDHPLQSEEKDQEIDHQLSTMRDKAIKDLFQEALLLEKKRLFKRQSQNL